MDFSLQQLRWIILERKVSFYLHRVKNIRVDEISNIFTLVLFRSSWYFNVLDVQEW
jgi:hypothetical protein